MKKTFVVLVAIALTPVVSLAIKQRQALPGIQAGESCRPEGKGAYVPNGEDHELFSCINGVWVFEGTEMPSERGSN